ncbi:DUF4315 family protein [uncultured Eubacterium sp.]|uniref:DUF4315 family protein n=1 Tax=uncultured Eubacterium sp. TaxID=165185 RepID=UPI00259A40FE|nr:DUF4315 family protein [uncultured Eubacterium sp.]
MNKRIKKYLEEIEKTEEKIEQLQSYVKGVRVALKQEEDNEIIKSIRSKKMSTEELVDFLSQIQDGSICLETRVKLQPETPQEKKEEES